jgi:hypothetical protein
VVARRSQHAPAGADAPACPRRAQLGNNLDTALVKSCQVKSAQNDKLFEAHYRVLAVASTCT